ncbi:Diphthine methyltransferase [Dirofilaria immitis]
MSGESSGHTIQQLTSNQSSTTATLPQYSVPAAQVTGASKYTQLLSVIEELGKDIRPIFANLQIKFLVCENSALCSDVCGRIHIINLETGNISFSFVGHTSLYTNEPCEVWTAIWLDTNCILSGGEDNLLKLWDLRLDTKQPININKTHLCGVISLHRENSKYIISGSYDDHVRRIDLRNFVQCILNRKMNGSAWSIRIADENSYIVSCMYGGWTIIEKKNFDILQKNDKLGEKLLYDADFSSQASAVVSCTFNNYAVNFETI